MSQLLTIYPIINAYENDSFQQYSLEFKQNQDQTSHFTSEKMIYEPEYFLNTEQLPKENNNNDHQNQFQNQQLQIFNQLCSYQSQSILNEDKKEQQKSIQGFAYFDQNNDIQFVTKQLQNQYFVSISEEEINNFHSDQLTYQEQQQQQQQQFNQENQQMVNQNSDVFLNYDKNQLKQQNQITVSIQKNQLNITQLNHLKTKKQQQQNQFKNIANAFKGYVKKQKNCDFVEISDYEFSNLKKQLMRYMKMNSFNYTLLKYIINHKFYKLLLLNFFQKESQDWINSSKLQDKQDVIAKIQQLTECIKYPQLLDSVLGQQKTKIKK